MEMKRKEERKRKKRRREKKEMINRYHWEEKKDEEEALLSESRDEHLHEKKKEKQRRRWRDDEDGDEDRREEEDEEDVKVSVEFVLREHRVEEQKEEKVLSLKRKRSKEEKKEEEDEALVEGFYHPLHMLFSSTKHVKSKDKLMLEKRGIHIKTGRFDKKEDDIITENFNRFVEENSLLHEMDMKKIKLLLLGYFYYLREKEERKRGHEIRKDFGFFLELGKGLPDRTLNQIYNRARQLIAPLKRMKHFTDEDKEQLLDFHKTNGKKWTVIAKTLDINPIDAKAFVSISLTRSGLKPTKGKFSREEDQQLVRALMRETKAKQVKDILTYRGIRWEEVASQVKSRTSYQCFYHFRNKLAYQIAFLDQRHFTIAGDQSEDDETNLIKAKLIYCLYKECYKSEDDIDWDLLKEKFASIASLRTLTLIWYNLKSEVRDFERKTYIKIVKRLFKRKLPKLIPLNGVNIKLLETFCE